MTDTCLKIPGYHEWASKSGFTTLENDFTPAQVIEVNKNSYIVDDGNHKITAELSGKFIFNAQEPTDYPTVGDWSAIQILDNYSLAIIHAILPRNTVLKRKSSGKRIQFQLIASNIDFGLILQSADDIKMNLLERYLTMLNESNITAIPVFSKMDLLNPEETETIRNQFLNFNHQCFFISNLAESGITELQKHLVPDKTYCLLGPSGVGKSSLLNKLLGTEKLKVSDVREKDGKGRHTTVRRQLIHLENRSIFIDTPGMRELGNFKIEQGLEQTFEAFSSFSNECRFKDCSHTNEAGCAVINAVKNGDIEENRYKNFLKLKKESEHYSMSYREKRQKDKSFGKMIKNFKKFKKEN